MTDQTFASVLADTIEEAGGSSRQSKTLNAHELANAIRLAELRFNQPAGDFGTFLETVQPSTRPPYPGEYADPQPVAVDL